MNSLTTICSIVTGAHDALETAVAEMPAELINKEQPGNSNTIGAIYAHAIINLDLFYIEAIQAKPLLLSANGFAEKLGLPDPTNTHWDILNRTNWDMQILQSYAQAVFKNINKYLDTLSDEALGYAGKVFDQEMTVAQMMSITTWHTALHAGEIAALKGVNAVKGLPF